MRRINNHPIYQLSQLKKPCGQGRVWQVNTGSDNISCVVLRQSRILPLFCAGISQLQLAFSYRTLLCDLCKFVRTSCTCVERFILLIEQSI